MGLDGVPGLGRLGRLGLGHRRSIRPFSSRPQPSLYTLQVSPPTHESILVAGLRPTARRCHSLRLSRPNKTPTQTSESVTSAASRRHRHSLTRTLGSSNCTGQHARVAHIGQLKTHRFQPPAHCPVQTDSHTRLLQLHWPTLTCRPHRTAHSKTHRFQPPTDCPVKTDSHTRTLTHSKTDSHTHTLAAAVVQRHPRPQPASFRGRAAPP